MAAAKSLTQDEINKVLAYIAANAYAQRNRVMFLLTAMAGLRVSEVAGLTLGDVRNADGTVRAEVFFAAHRVKHGHARTVYLNSRLQQELATYVQSRNWIDDTQTLFPTHTAPAIKPCMPSLQNVLHLHKRIRLNLQSSAMLH